MMGCKSLLDREKGAEQSAPFFCFAKGEEVVCGSLCDGFGLLFTMILANFAYWLTHGQSAIGWLNMWRNEIKTEYIYVSKSIWQCGVRYQGHHHHH